MSALFSLYPDWMHPRITPQEGPCVVALGAVVRPAIFLRGIFFSLGEFVPLEITAWTTYPDAPLTPPVPPSN